MVLKHQLFHRQRSVAVIALAVFATIALLLKKGDVVKNESAEQTVETFVMAPEQARLAEQPNNSFTEIAIKDLEKVKELREEPKEKDVFDRETLALAQDVMHAAGRVSYFPARRALIEHLMKEEHAAKLEDTILNYDNMAADTAELPVIAHFSFIALGELSRTEGTERAARIYEGLARRLSILDGQESTSNIKKARLTDIYDLTRHIIRGQIDGNDAGWSDIMNILDQFKVKDHFLNGQIKQELKNAIASVSKLETVADLDDLHAKLDEWWE